MADKARNARCPKCGEKNKHCQCQAMSSKLMNRLSVVMAFVGIIVVIVMAFQISKLETKGNLAISSSRQMLRKLIAMHPSKEVKQQMLELIDTGEIMLTFESMNSAIGHPVAAIILMDDDKEGEVIALNFSAQSLLDQNLSVEYAQLVLRHEWQHYKQLIEGSAPKDLFRLKPSRKFGEKKEDVKIWFETELEAYVPECQLAIKQGWLKHIDLCNSYAQGGISGLRQHLSVYFSQATALQYHKDLILRLGHAK